MPITPASPRAEYKQVTHSRACKPRDILRFSRDKAPCKALQRPCRAGGLGHRRINSFRERRRDRHVVIAGKIEEAFGEIGVVHS